MSTDFLLMHIVRVLDSLVQSGPPMLDTGALDSLIVLKAHSNMATDNKINAKIALDAVKALDRHLEADEMDRMQKDYAARDGAFCPYCGSNDLRPEDFNAEFCIDSVFIPCKCLSCNREWSDQYKLVGFSPTESK